MPAPRISFVTIATDDLERSLAFYRSWMLLGDEQIRHGGDHAALDLGGGFSLVLYPRASIAAAAATDVVRGAPAFILSHEAATAEEAEQIVAAGIAAGGTQPRPPERGTWGVSSYLRDPDGHLWEIVCFSGS